MLDFLLRASEGLGRKCGRWETRHVCFRRKQTRKQNKYWVRSRFRQTPSYSQLFILFSKQSWPWVSSWLTRVLTHCNVWLGRLLKSRRIILRSLAASCFLLAFLQAAQAKLWRGFQACRPERWVTCALHLTLPVQKGSRRLQLGLRYNLQWVRKWPTRNEGTNSSCILLLRQLCGAGGRGGGVAWSGVGKGVLKILSHWSARGCCRPVGDGDWEALIIKLYIKY